MSRTPLRALAAVLALSLLPACVAVAPPPSGTAAPSVAPSVAPTAPPQARSLLALLDDRDRAHAAGDESGTLALVADAAPTAYREREIALARAGGRRRGAAPQRTLLGVNVGGTEGRLEVAELDDQGRERRVRYFFTGLPDAPRLTEPMFGPERTLEFVGGTIRHRAFDEDQAEILKQLLPAAVAWLLARLGAEYEPQAPFALALRPDVVAELPPLASAYVAQGQVTFLSSASMLVASGPGSAWTRTLVTHEVAHVLLFQRGSGTFLLNEGIPLWLTDDRRQPELDRLVAANALWTLERLIDGPRDQSEFFAGYAQAGAFVRFTAERHGDRAVVQMWEAGRRVPFADAYREATGIDAAAAHAAWRATLGR